MNDQLKAFTSGPCGSANLKEPDLPPYLLAGRSVEEILQGGVRVVERTA
ncbi:hypothetical protein [Glycomyces algeriensis]|nr:hypothetical protein [Glycomyces algeriensis]MDA1367537.1 hypothetical protein [Glycomyces algeriensis]MDR7353100.1 hypothetical protein [Glycomyces algeriensis]